MDGRHGGTPAWTHADSYLWYTIDILAAALSSTARSRPPVLAPFPPSFAPDEWMLAEGPVTLYELLAAGDGTYQRSTVLLTGSGRLGLGLLAGSLGASAIGNARRRARAADDAQVRWRPVDRGGGHDDGLLRPPALLNSERQPGVLT